MTALPSPDADRPTLRAHHGGVLDALRGMRAPEALA